MVDGKVRPGWKIPVRQYRQFSTNEQWKPWDLVPALRNLVKVGVGMACMLGFSCTDDSNEQLRWKPQP